MNTVPRVPLTDSTCRVICDQAPTKSKPSSNDNESTKPDFGEEDRSPSPAVRTPTPGPIRSPGERTDDIGKITLDQDAAHHCHQKQNTELFHPRARPNLDELCRQLDLTGRLRKVNQVNHSLEISSNLIVKDLLLAIQVLLIVPMAEISGYVIRRETAAFQAQHSEGTNICTIQAILSASQEWL